MLGKDFIQGLTTDGTGSTIYGDKIYKTNMTEPNKKFVLSLHYNGNNSYLFVNGKEESQFKSQSLTSTKKSQLFCVGNFSVNWASAENPKTSLYGNVYDYVYEPLSDVKTIYDIHSYLMMKHNI